MIPAASPTAAGGGGDGGRVLLVSMPFATADLPSLALATLQGHLRRAGHHCDLRHFNLDLVPWVGEDLLRAVSYFGYRTGEWLFAPALYGFESTEADVERFLPHLSALGRSLGRDEAVPLLQELRGRCTEFVSWCTAEIDWRDYDVVGFTSMFSQTIPSLALATRIKAAHPEVGIVFGGANVHGEMGLALHESFDVIDVVCVGEGDAVIAPVVDSFLGRRELDSIPGIVHRGVDRSVVTEQASLVTDLDRLPLPDYADWLADRDRVGLGDRDRRLLIETSRGCWWGAISHCTFCGLNPTGMTYRSKSADRTLAELHHLRDRHGVDVVQAVDNILDMRYFRSLFPALAETDPPFSLFYDLKASLTHRQVGQLKAAGVHEILPGIESLSDAVLTRMAKGTTALMNLQLLKWCAEYDIAVEWNLIHGFPGDQAHEYEAMLPLIDACRHLQPPNNMQPVVIDRFSPFHAHPESLGFTGLEAAPVYRELYPFPAAVLDRIAFEFVGDHVPGWEPCDADAIVGDSVRSWMERGAGGGLWVHFDGDSVHLADDRDHRARPLRLSLGDWRAVVYRAADRVRDVDELRPLGPDPATVDRFLDWCVRERLMVVDGTRCLAVAVHTPARRIGGGSRRSVFRAPRTRIPVTAAPA